jgi:cobalt-zinc-cadmium efflux system outer membrane protein
MFHPSFTTRAEEIRVGRRVASSASLALILLILSTRPLAAQGSDTLRLTSDDAVARVLAAGPGLLRATGRITRAHAERLRSASLLPSLPDLELLRETDAPFEGKGEGGWEVGLSQRIEIAGRRELAREGADAAVDKAVLDARSEELALRAEARRAFAALVAAEDRARLADRLLGFATRLDTAAARLLSAGEISELDRNAIRVERGTAAIERVNAAGALAVARADLAAMLGLSRRVVLVPIRDPLSTTDSARNATLALVAEAEASLASGSDTLATRRPEWLATERELERLQAERSIAARAWVPDITVGASVKSDRLLLDGDDLRGSDLVRGGFYGIDKRETLLGVKLGLALPLPIGGLYDLGAADAAVADAEMTAVETERVGIISTARADIERSAARLRAASEAIGLYERDVVPVVDRNMELLERGYVGGELSASQIIAGEQQLARVEEAAIDARREYHDALAEFERAIGR